MEPPAKQFLNRMTIKKCLLAALAVALPLVCGAQGGGETIKLQIGLHQIDAELAATESQRQQGLMFRTWMPQHEGMLFVFVRPERHCMWMKDTPLPLAVAFADADGKILNIENMQPGSLQSHCAATDEARFALEMNQGWFAQRNILPGSHIEGLETLYALQ